MLVYSAICESEPRLGFIAKEIYDKASTYNIWLLEGDMGAGKTTFVQHLAIHLGFGKVSSPTFSLVNQYFSPKIGEVYHFDFYRINEETEALDIGIDEYLYSGNLCLIEWSSKINNLIPKKIAKIEINLCNLNQRTFNLYLHGGQNEI